jgi:hypothetical protein
VISSVRSVALQGVTFILMGVPWPAWATPAQQLFEEARFRECVVAVEKSVAELPREQRDDAYILLARCQEALGNSAQAEKALAAALALNPLTALNPAVDKPAFVELLDRLKQKAQGRISIGVKNRTPNTFVLIDGEILPFPSTEKTLSIGEHRVQLVDAKGQELQKARALVSVNQTLILEFVEAPRGVVEKAPSELDPPPLEISTPAALERPSRMLGLRLDVRIDVLSRGGLPFSFGIGPTLAWHWFRLQAAILLASRVGAQLRAGAAWGVTGPVAVGLTLDASLWAYGAPVGDVGGTLELEISPANAVKLFLGISGKWAPEPPAGYRNLYFLLNAGAAWDFFKW